MEVEAFLDDVDDGRIHVKDTARCTLDAWPELPYGCTVVEISPIAQEAGFRSLRRRFRVRLSLDRTESERMRPGMSLRAEVIATVRNDVVLAPRAALDLDANPVRAFRSDGDIVEVALGECNALECVIESGLVPGIRLSRAQ